METTELPSPPLKGIDVIKDHLKRLPGKPGVYRMFGADEEVLYVGKAKNLKNRVANYAKLGGHTQRIALMISLTCLLYTSPSPRDRTRSRMPSSA